MGVLLRAQRGERAVLGVEVEGFLGDLLPALQHLPLPRDLRLDSPLEEPEAVHVLELGLGAQLVGPGRANGDVAIDAKAALLHVHIGDAELADRRPEQLRPLAGLRRGADVGLGDDLDQRSAAPVEVHQRGTGAVDPSRLPHVVELGGVLLEVGAMDADLTQAAVDRDRFVVLADLVALRQVGIEVVLASEDRPARHIAFERRRDHQSGADRLLVDRRQGPRMSEADRAGVHVGLVAEGDGAAAEHLRLGRELDVDLEPDHRLVAVRGHQAAPPSPSRRKPIAPSSARAASSIAESLKAGPAI